MPRRTSFSLALALSIGLHVAALLFPDCPPRYTRMPLARPLTPLLATIKTRSPSPPNPPLAASHLTMPDEIRGQDQNPPSGTLSGGDSRRDEQNASIESGDQSLVGTLDSAPKLIDQPNQRRLARLVTYARANIRLRLTISPTGDVSRVAVIETDPVPDETLNGVIF